MALSPTQSFLSCYIYWCLLALGLEAEGAVPFGIYTNLWRRETVKELVGAPGASQTFCSEMVYVISVPVYLVKKCHVDKPTVNGAATRVAPMAGALNPGARI